MDIGLRNARLCGRVWTPVDTAWRSTDQKDGACRTATGASSPGRARGIPRYVSGGFGVSGVRRPARRSCRGSHSLSGERHRRMPDGPAPVLSLHGVPDLWCWIPARRPHGAGRPKRTGRHGVAPALGEPVAPEAQRVSPTTEPEVFQLRLATERARGRPPLRKAGAPEYPRAPAGRASCGGQQSRAATRSQPCSAGSETGSFVSRVSRWNPRCHSTPCPRHHRA
jgi:hypothetical protein